MSIYGEGLYETADGHLAVAVERDREKLERGDWEPSGPKSSPLKPLPTPEWKPPALSSIYALNKFDQERMCLLFGASYGVPTVALRLFNVYGRDQSLSNPYTGVLAIFAGRLINGRPPLIFEDGEQRRDLVSVQDVARAFGLALERPEANGQSLNIGSGVSRSISEIAHMLADATGHEEIEPEITGKYRVGDVRHCFADVSMAKATIGYAPEVELERGMSELADWLEHQVSEDRSESATAELAAKGLTL
jgi:dTDP-L-rhamnose 4-epimerase